MNTVKNFLILWIVVLLCIGCENLTQSGLDPIRVKPQHEIKLPDIKFDEEGVHYLIEPYVTDGNYKKHYGAHYLIHARRDKSGFYLRPDIKSRDVVDRNYSYYFITHYPEMRWLNRSQNEHCISKPSSCKGRIKVHVQFASLAWRKNGIANYLVGVTEREIKYWTKDPKEIPRSDLGGVGLVPTYLKQRKLLSQIVYLHLSDDGKPLNFIKCDLKTVISNCNTNVSSERYPMLRYEVRFREELLPEWKNIIKSVRDHVDGQIQAVYIVEK